jgi:hypothetical protein
MDEGRLVRTTYFVFWTQSQDVLDSGIVAHHDLRVGIITNPLVALSAPFEFKRANPADYSLVELKTIKDLGGPATFSKDWMITGEREMFVPQRVARQRQMQQEENDRLRNLDLPLADSSLIQLSEFLAAQNVAKAGA